MGFPTFGLHSKDRIELEKWRQNYQTALGEWERFVKENQSLRADLAAARAECERLATALAGADQVIAGHAETIEEIARDNGEMDAECERLKEELTQSRNDEHLACTEFARLRAELAARPGLVWTTEEPTKPGWYWWQRNDEWERGKPGRVSHYEFDEFWQVVRGPIREGMRWAGPIPEPREPGGSDDA